jgi:hypothetical protein
MGAALAQIFSFQRTIAKLLMRISNGRLISLLGLIKTTSKSLFSQQRAAHSTQV